LRTGCRDSGTGFDAGVAQWPEQSPEAAVKYLIMIQSNPSFAAVWDRMTDEQLRGLGLRHRALNEDLARRGELVASEGLDDVAQTRRVTVRDGRTIVSDGPMAEAKEHLAGFYLVECSAERAVEIAAQVPDAAWSEVLVRPVLDLSPHP
jgi:hypothetical protein